MQVCFFSDTKAINFNPLTLTRPLDDLRIGIFPIRRKWELWLNANINCRILPDYLQDVFSAGQPDTGQEYLWINARFLPDSSLTEHVQQLSTGQALAFQGDIVAAKINGEDTRRMHSEKKLDSSGLSVRALDEATCIENLWDLLKLNAAQIESDLTLTSLKSEGIRSRYQGLTFSGEDNIYIADDVHIEPGCIIIADDGPVIIQSGAVIEAGSILRGPVAICQNATVKMKARIYGGTTIGPVCKVAGEVAGSIFHSYSNKAHDGFVGDSLFGQWVNLGADTNTSNLKNNYSTVQLTHWNSGRQVETGMQFLGTVMADHSKTAINTMLNTGTICGVSSNIFMSGFPPKHIPSFSWVGSADFQLYRFEKAMETMSAMMERRNISPDSAYRKMMKHIFDNR